MGIGKLLPVEVKSRLKTWRNQARAAYINRFYPFTPDDLLRSLQALGIQRGDVVIAHTSFDQFQGFQGGFSEAIHVLQTAVGEEGGLLMPTLPFGGSAIDYAKSGRITDVARTPSRMGFLTEIFRRLPGVTRSIHPTHLVAGWGRKAPGLLENHYLAQTPCGRSSPFSKLLEVDGKILLAGASIRSMTFYHYLEELLEPEMPFSPLTQEVFELQTRGADGQIYDTRTRLYDPAISSCRDCELMIDPLRARSAWKETKIGRLPVICLKASDVLKTVEEMASQRRYCYRMPN